MKLPGTIDRLRRASGADRADEWEYVEIDDEDVVVDDDDWEYVLVDERPVSDLTGVAPADVGDGSGSGRWVGRLRLRSLSPAVRGGTGAEDDLGDADGWDDDLGPDDPAVGPDDALGVDPRIAARRDSVALARRARLRRRATAVLVVLAVVVGLGALTRSAALDVDSVRVIGAEQSDPSALATASGIAIGTPLIGLDLDAATDAVEAQPWVLDASVERSWSGEIVVTVAERRPVATVNAGAGGWLLIDGDRRIVAASVDPPDLPIVDGIGAGSVGDELDPSAQAALDVAAALTPGLRTRVAIVDGADPDSVRLILQPTGTVDFGPATNVDQRIRTLQSMFAHVDMVCLATIDLQGPDAAVLTRVPACA